MVTITLLPKQWDFLKDEKQQCLFLGGVGSSKSSSLALWIIKTAAEYPKSKGLIVANTFLQLTSATLTSLEEWCERCEVPFRKNMNKKCVYVNNSEIMVRSADAAVNSRGIETGYI